MKDVVVIGAGKIGSTIARLLSHSGDYMVTVADRSEKQLADIDAHKAVKTAVVDIADAAALKVLTGYTHIGGEDVTSFALRPRVKGEVTVVDEIVQQAAEAASNLLVPEGLAADTWGKLSGIERFVLRMMDMETTGARKLDNYQNFAKAFRVQDYARVMASMAPNEARLKQVPEFASRDLTDSTELGATRLGRLVIALQQMRADLEPQTIISQLQAEMPDFLEARPLLVDLLAFVERKAPEADVRTAAEVLGARLKNQRFGI